MPNTPDMKDLRLEHFTACLGDDFHLDAGDADDTGGMHLKVVEAAELPTAKNVPEGQRKGFSVIFRGPAEPALEQRIYTLEHGDVGRHAIFLVPVSQDDDGRYYEAVFT